MSTTSKSYEGQLSMMSDHLAGMNEKLTSQKDEIDDLKAQLANTKSSASKVNLTVLSHIINKPSIGQNCHCGQVSLCICWMVVGSSVG